MNREMLLPRSLGIGGNQQGKLHPEVSVFQQANTFSAVMGKWDAFSPQLVCSTGDSQFFIYTSCTDSYILRKEPS